MTRKEEDLASKIDKLIEDLTIKGSEHIMLTETMKDLKTKCTQQQQSYVTKLEVQEEANRDLVIK